MRTTIWMSKSWLHTGNKEKKGVGGMSKPGLFRTLESNILQQSEKYLLLFKNWFYFSRKHEPCDIFNFTVLVGLSKLQRGLETHSISALWYAKQVLRNLPHPFPAAPSPGNRETPETPLCSCLHFPTGCLLFTSTYPEVISQTHAGAVTK